MTLSEFGANLPSLGIAANFLPLLFWVAVVVLVIYLIRRRK